VYTVPNSLACAIDAAVGALERRHERLGFQLAVRSGKRDELGSARERLRRAAFGGVDMRLLVAIDGAIGPGAGRKRQGVGRRAGGHGEDRHFALEELGELPVQQCAVFVIAIRGGQSTIGGFERAHDLGRDGSHIVAAEAERNGAGMVIQVLHS
jgi:hypothetical protein